jgi:multicomponent Na+:H+ antiporter subunit G
MFKIILDLLSVAALLAGVFFMFIGALGLWRLNDFYNRMHAAAKCITLGISGMLLALVIHISAVEGHVSEGGEAARGMMSGTTVVGAVTKALLVILFQFVAAPVGAHMLARAAHLDRVPQWEGSVGDELEEDTERASSATAQRESRLPPPTL